MHVAIEQWDYIKEANTSGGLGKVMSTLLFPWTQASSEMKQGDTSTWFPLPLAQRALPTSSLTSVLICAVISLHIFSMVFLTGKKLPTGIGIEISFILIQFPLLERSNLFIFV